MQKIKVKSARPPAGWRLSSMIVAAALALSVADAGHAQGIVRGAQEGSYDGNREGHRVAGPVGGVVGGAVGAGVGGGVGAVEGVFGTPHFHHWHHHCRGSYDGYGRYRCYR